MCKRIRRGERADDDRLAFELIRRVGPGGEYLTQDHTFQNFRRELYTNVLEEKDSFENWKLKGALSIDRRANRKWKETLEAYREPELPEETGKALRRYMARKYGG
jgi:trimethylamine--corrinoid protein Co-methyltransferase